MTKERKYYWWITAVDPESKRPYLIFGAADENQARERGLELLGGIDFQLKRLPTSHLATASSLLKGNRLEETHSLSKAGQRLGHAKSLQRMKRRRATSPAPHAAADW